MSKIFGIGLPRTGTASLCETFVILGYKARHYPKYIDRAKIFEALVDSPICNEFETLDELYPDSKFILSVRDLDGWLASCKAASRKFMWKRLSPVGRCGPEVYRSHMNLFNTTKYDEAKFVEGYHRHYDRVIEYFEGRDDLLVYNLSDKDKMEKICAFLGKEIPDGGFPHRNKSRK